MSNFELNNKEISVLSKWPPTLTKFFAHAFTVIGRCIYVYGGGWYEEKEGHYKVKPLGVSKKWKEFYSEQGNEYNFRDYELQEDLGLDCSAYVAWIILNTFHGFNYGDDFLTFARKMSKFYAKKGYGACTHYKKYSKCTPGSIMSMPKNNHVHIPLQTFSDGSIVFLHSTDPDGPTIMGTCTPNNEPGEAIESATKIMTKYFPNAQKKFPKREKGEIYLDCDYFEWNQTILKDPDGLRHKTADEILHFIQSKIQELKNNCKTTQE